METAQTSPVGRLWDGTARLDSCKFCIRSSFLWQALALGVDSFREQCDTEQSPDRFLDRTHCLLSSVFPGPIMAAAKIPHLVAFSQQKIRKKKVSDPGRQSFLLAPSRHGNSTNRSRHALYICATYLVKQCMEVEGSIIIGTPLAASFAIYWASVDYVVQRH